MKIAGDCPHCKKDIEVDIDKLTLNDVSKPIENPTATQATQQIQKEPEIKEVIKEVVKVPSHIPNFKCKNGNCGETHPNKDYTKKPKAKCKNCEQFSPSMEDICPWCSQKEWDELDDEDLEELGIPLPKPEVHDHAEL